MSKKDYVKIAAIIKNARENQDEETAEYIARKLVEVFEEDNRRFDFLVFFKACGIKEMKR